MHKLYHYVHCPFCLRVRFVLGFLDYPWESIVLAYDDEQTPKKLAGKKMLPIMQFQDETIMNESLDIIEKLTQESPSEKSKQLRLEILKTNQAAELESLLAQLSGPLFKLCMPQMIYTQEFDEKARNYFQTKKEAKRGPFYRLVQEREKFEKELVPFLEKIEKDLRPYYQYEQLSILDILIASHLWGLYLVSEFQFTPKMHDYLQTIKKLTHFDYQSDFWKSEKSITTTYQR